MKKCFLISISIILTLGLFAQQNYEDVVYLKNGSIIHGLIIEQIPNKSLKIQTLDNNIFVFNIDEVEKFTKEIIPNKSNKIENKNTHENIIIDKKTEKINISGLEKGYQLILEPGIGYGSTFDDYGKNMVKMEVVNGFRFNSIVSIGLGTGLRYYSVGSSSSNIKPEEYLVLPYFFDVRVNMINKRVSPFFSLGLGYCFSIINDLGSGFLAKPSAGISFRVGQNSMHFGLCADLQQIDFTANNYYYNTFNNKLSVSFGLNFGISF